MFYAFHSLFCIGPGTDNRRLLLQGDPGSGNKFPSPEYEALATDVYNGFKEIGLTLTQQVCNAYGLSETWVKDSCSGVTMTAMKVLHYPVPSEEECGGLRMAPHFDIDAITVLYQDPNVPGGLQVNLHGEWEDVAAPPGALVINVGELLKFISAGTVKCTEHRVVMPGKEQLVNSERVSIALFLNTRADVVILTAGTQSTLDGAGTTETAGEWMMRHVASFQDKKGNGVDQSQ